MTQTTMFKSFEARDAALESVNRPSYTNAALDELLRLMPVGQLTGEDIRIKIEAAIGAPHHHNAWGAVIAQGIKRGILVHTGKMAHMRTKRSHARRTPTYTVERPEL